MDEDPFAVPADGDRDRLHRGEAVGRPVAWVVVDVTAPEAARTVIAMCCAGGVGWNVQPAVVAAKAARLFQRSVSR
jgi:hypothetical protein